MRTLPRMCSLGTRDSVIDISAEIAAFGHIIYLLFFIFSGLLIGCYSSFLVDLFHLILNLFFWCFWIPGASVPPIFIHMYILLSYTLSTPYYLSL